ncbi:MAG: AIR synthase-related protein, partial [Methanobrevibacter sp.]
NAKIILGLLDEDSQKDITAVHDVSAGGLAVALSEMVISSDLGCEVELASDELDENQLLYSESHGRYLITVKADALDHILSKIDVPVTVLGEVKGDVLKINENEFSIEELKDSYYGVIEKYMA